MPAGKHWKFWVFVGWLATVPTALALPRVVTTSPAATELFFQLGLQEMLVGTVEWSDYPAAAKAIPRVGPLAFPGLEAILRRQPDCVVVDTTQPSPDWNAALRRGAIEPVAWSPTSVGGYFADTKALLSAMGAPASAHALLESFRKIWNHRRTDCVRAHGKILLLASTDPTIAFGAETFLVDAFRQLGAEPVLPGALTGFAAVGPDWMRAQSIDRVVWIDFQGPSPARELRHLVGLRPILEPLDADHFSRPGWTAMEALLNRYCSEIAR